MFEFVRKVADQNNLRTFEMHHHMVDALELGDRYHMKKTPGPANIEVATTFTTNLLRLQQAVFEHEPTSTAIDHLIGQGYAIDPTANIEVSNSASNEVFENFKRRVIDQYAAQVITTLNASKRFTREEIEQQPPVDRRTKWNRH